MWILFVEKKCWFDILSWVSFPSITRSQNYCCIWRFTFYYKMSLFHHSFYLQRSWDLVVVGTLEVPQVLLVQHMFQWLNLAIKYFDHEAFTGWWFQTVFYFHPYLGRWSNLTNIAQVGWNHQVVYCLKLFSMCRWTINELNTSSNAWMSRCFNNTLWDDLGKLQVPTTSQCTREARMFLTQFIQLRDLRFTIAALSSNGCVVFFQARVFCMPIEW